MRHLLLGLAALVTCSASTGEAGNVQKTDFGVVSFSQSEKPNDIVVQRDGKDVAKHTFTLPAPPAGWKYKAIFFQQSDGTFFVTVNRCTEGRCLFPEKKFRVNIASGTIIDLDNKKPDKGTEND